MERYDGGEPDEDEEITEGDPDWDLSEAHGYLWYPEREHGPVPPWLMLGVSVLVVVSLVAPGLYLIWRYG
ncbi:MAG: hypothetical protein WEC75_00640 [Dehalococcoidia bacterium]